MAHGMSAIPTRAGIAAGFACPNRGAAFDLAVAKAVMADIERAGGIEGLRRDEGDAENGFHASIGIAEIMNSDASPRL